MHASSPHRSLLCSLLIIGAAVACSGSDTGADTIDRETFISTYVDLRAAALRRDSREITDEERDSILGEYGVTEDELLSFAEVHGREVPFMQDLWDEVEGRLDAIRPMIDDVGTR